VFIKSISRRSIIGSLSKSPVILLVTIATPGFMGGVHLDLDTGKDQLEPSLPVEHGLF
jgi:hypothetical protein